MPNMNSILMAGAFLLALPAAAQMPGQPPKAFVCQFIQAVNYPTGLAELSDEDFRLTFASIDIKKRSAQLIGSAGASDVHFTEGLYVYNFIEETGAGNLNITTIYKDNRKNMQSTKEGFVAVHSRHVAIAFNPSPSQRIGLCFPRI